MSQNNPGKTDYLLYAVFLILPPLIGVCFSNLPIRQFLEFPPKTTYVLHHPCNHYVFIFGLLLSVAFMAPFVFLLLKRRNGPPDKTPGTPGGRLPWWGHLGWVLLVVSWALAWDLMPKGWRPLRDYTFTPLWLGFILLINGINVRVRGYSLLTRRPGPFLLLFPLSSLFWWYFEFLNRFVQNWHYIGVESYGPWKYAGLATLAFSTVLPAVVSVNELLKGSVHIKRAFGHLRPFAFRRNKLAWGVCLVLTVFSLGAIGIFPDYLFPILWVAPLLIITSIQGLLSKPTIFTPISLGRWDGVVRLGISGLICGFLWEMWNYYSYPKWIYSIPFVGQCKIFEMPLLGYMGYIPFGLECGAVSALVLGLDQVLNSACYQELR